MTVECKKGKFNIYRPPRSRTYLFRSTLVDTHYWNSWFSGWLEI